MKRNLKLSIAVLLLLLICSPSYGWNDAGHMAVAFVTYKNLTPITRARVDRLIRLNPNYNLWLEKIPPGVSETTKRGMIFMLAATWADQIKGDRDYVADGPDLGNQPPDNDAAVANIGYPDRALHKYWHFIDRPFSRDGTKTIP